MRAHHLHRHRNGRRQAVDHLAEAVADQQHVAVRIEQLRHPHRVSGQHHDRLLGCKAVVRRQFARADRGHGGALAGHRRRRRPAGAGVDGEGRHASASSDPKLSQPAPLPRPTRKGEDKACQDGDDDRYEDIGCRHQRTECWTTNMRRNQDQYRDGRDKHERVGSRTTQHEQEAAQSTCENGDRRRCEDPARKRLQLRALSSGSLPGSAVRSMAKPTQPRSMKTSDAIAAAINQRGRPSDSIMEAPFP